MCQLGGRRVGMYFGAALTGGVFRTNELCFQVCFVRDGYILLRHSLTYRFQEVHFMPIWTTFLFLDHLEGSANFWSRGRECVARLVSCFAAVFLAYSLKMEHSRREIRDRDDEPHPRSPRKQRNAFYICFVAATETGIVWNRAWNYVPARHCDLLKRTSSTGPLVQYAMSHVPRWWRRLSRFACGVCLSHMCLDCALASGFFFGPMVLIDFLFWFSLLLATRLLSRCNGRVSFLGVFFLYLQIA